ncbi:unnamed protein product [Albugo candida]|uniref:Uncharacterized protein n=1 Tax=Albugo candida TaxID=65357 RepID=A0A024GQS4_9STRA|nr:unnamed protein product [Albugo candida]|eukprot:CCI48886.1 unnamed protein product [Albugo candida]
MTSSSYDAIIEVVLTNCYVSTDSIKGALLALSRSCHLTELVSFFCTTLQSSGCGRTTSKLSKIDHHQFAIDASKSKRWSLPIAFLFLHCRSYGHLEENERRILMLTSSCVCVDNILLREGRVSNRSDSLVARHRCTGRSFYHVLFIGELQMLYKRQSHFYSAGGK